MRLFAALFGLLLSALAIAPRAEAAVDIQVDLSTQTMRVRASSGESYVWPVSTARKGYVTPRGVYRSQRLARMHYSRKYDMSPMPHSIFFRGGYAIHGTGAVGRLGTPASHGCVRLAPGNAAKLFSLVQREGARIAISGQAPQTTMVASAKHKRLTLVAAAKHKPHVASASRARTKASAFAYAKRHMPAQALGYAPLRGTDTPIEFWLRRPAGR